MSETKMKLVTIPSRTMKEYKNFKEYTDAYLDKVYAVINGYDVVGVENNDAKDIDYPFIFNKMKNEALNNFPDEFNIFDFEVTDIKSLEEFVNGYVADAYSKTPTVPRLNLVCKDCGKTFSMFNWDILFYEKNGYLIPKRCKECRAVRRASRNKEE